MTAETRTIILLALLAAAGLVWVVALALRKPYSPTQWTLYLVNLILTRFVWRTRAPNYFPVPAEGGAVVISNHRSSVDPCFIQLVAKKRLVHWLVAQLYGDNWFLAWLMDQCEVIPVQRRGSDTTPTKKAIRLASEGQLVGMFPEGRINTTDQFMLPVRPGAILVALKARVPILPCYIEGAPYHEIPWRPIFIPARVRLKIGRLIDLSDYYGHEKDHELIAQLTLFCVRQIALLAGRDDFEPQLAGRDWKTWRE